MGSRADEKREWEEELKGPQVSGPSDWAEGGRMFPRLQRMNLLGDVKLLFETQRGEPQVGTGWLLAGLCAASPCSLLGRTADRSGPANLQDEKPLPLVKGLWDLSNSCMSKRTSH